MASRLRLSSRAKHRTRASCIERDGFSKRGRRPSVRRVPPGVLRDVPPSREDRPHGRAVSVASPRARHALRAPRDAHPRRQLLLDRVSSARDGGPSLDGGRVVRRSRPDASAEAQDALDAQLQKHHHLASVDRAVRGARDARRVDVRAARRARRSRGARSGGRDESVAKKRTFTREIAESPRRVLAADSGREPQRQTAVFTEASFLFANPELLGVRVGGFELRDGRHGASRIGRARKPRVASAGGSRRPRLFARFRRSAQLFEIARRAEHGTPRAFLHQTALLFESPGAHAVVAGGRPDGSARTESRAGETRRVRGGRFVSRRRL